MQIVRKDMKLTHWDLLSERKRKREREKKYTGSIDHCCNWLVLCCFWHCSFCKRKRAL